MPSDEHVDIVIKDVTISQRMRDNYVDATSMCNQFRSRLCKDYLSLQRTKEYLEELSQVIGTPLADLVEVRRGGMNQGTWVHPRVCVDLARWLCPRFAVAMGGWFLMLHAVPANVLEAHAGAPAEIAAPPTSGATTTTWRH